MTPEERGKRAAGIIKHFQLELEEKLIEARRIAGNQRSQKNYWKREALKLRKEVNLQKAMRKNVENVNEMFSTFNEYLLVSKSDIIEKWDMTMQGWKKSKLLADYSNFAFYAQLALWIIWS